jgi:hypothetical protein
VICQENNQDFELESQIYGLTHSDTEHIASCNLVFLIPPDSDGTERYYVYYDETQTPAPAYPDHVSIAESSYFYEPIPGYSVRSHFYEMIQNGSIVYTVAQDGTYLWYTTAQFVTKLSVGVTEQTLQNAQTAASFEFAYYYGDKMWQYNSTSQQLVSKDILCDGNLMVSCQIVSRSTGGELQTTAVYKYFYCPTLATRIHAHVIHEALRDCQVYPGTNTDGTYAGMQCGVMKSQSIRELNFGKLYPYIHVSSEHNIIEEYRVDLNPEYNQENPVTWLLQTSDDVDLGEKSWTSFDEGSTGAVHALVFASPSVLKAGVGERDGIQVKAYESDYPHLPGLTYTIAGFQFTRNTYEQNVSGKDTVIPRGFTAEFDAEFFSSPIGGYPIVEQETDLFQALTKMAPPSEPGNQPGGNETSNRFGLTVYVHGALSLPLGSALSALTGRSFPYLSVEVCQDGTVVSSGTASRIPLRSVLLSNSSSLRERLSAVFRMFDFRNGSLWKKIGFEGLLPGRYLVKVFRENPGVGEVRRFLGYAIVDLSQDISVHVWCHPQGSCRVTVVDQEGDGISGAQVQLLSQGMVLSQNVTDASGSALLAAPCSGRDRYALRVIYNGFEVVNDSLVLRLSHAIFPLRLSYEFDRFTWTLHLVDLWGLPPGVNVRPRLTSTQMVTPLELAGQEQGNGAFVFSDLISASYQLTASYKSFVVEQDVRIPTGDSVVEFPAQFPVSFRVLDSHGISISGVTVQFQRGGRTKEITGNGSRTVLTIPPGVYQVSVRSADGTVIGQRMLDVVGDRSLDFFTTQNPVFPWFLIIFCIILVLIGGSLSFLKKDVVYVSLFLVVGIGVATLAFPWWSLQGSSAGVQASSQLYLIPLNLVSMTTTSLVIAGELSYFPEVFMTVMAVVVWLMILSWCGVGVWFGLRRVVRRRWLMAGVEVVACSLLIVSLAMFTVAMSAFTEVGVGSLLGQGTLDVAVQGQGGVVPVLCHWGPGVGFWLCIVSVTILIFTMLYNEIKKKMRA